MREKLVTDRLAEGFYDELQLEQLLRDKDQREAVREAEIAYLEETETHAEFCEAMKDKNEMVAEPDIPLDEATYRDYRIRRAAGEGK